MLSKMIFGCGTGRCGTWTLYRILESQKGVSAGHEGFPLPWQIDLSQLWHMIIGIQARVRTPKLANSSFVWMRYAGAIMAEIPDPRFICLQRCRTKVVQSYLKHLPNLNYWTDPGSKHWDPQKDTSGVQSAMWPEYDLPKGIAIARYWDDYYAQAEYLQSRFPQNFRIFDMDEALNTEPGQREMLTFAGFKRKDQQIFLNRKLNALGNPKGQLNVEAEYVHSGQSFPVRSAEVGSKPRMQVRTES